jgi:hypothetical protein
MSSIKLPMIFTITYLCKCLSNIGSLTKEWELRVPKANDGNWFTHLNTNMVHRWALFCSGLKEWGQFCSCNGQLCFLYHTINWPPKTFARQVETKWLPCSFGKNHYYALDVWLFISIFITFCVYAQSSQRRCLATCILNLLYVPITQFFSGCFEVWL